MNELHNNLSGINTLFSDFFEGVVVVGSDCKILFVNNVTASILQIEKQRLEGMFIWDALPLLQDRKSVDKHFFTSRLKNDPGKISGVYEYVHDGKAITLELTAGFVRKIEQTMIVLRDITERKDMERRKDNFINMASHELNTPVTTLKMLNRMMKEVSQKGEIERLPKYSSKMDKQLNRLNKLIDELLNISRIQSGKFDLDKQLFDINALIRETVENIQVTTQKHHISIKGGAKKMIMGDEDRIGQVLVNLLTNAIKYSPDGGDVNVVVRELKDMIRVEVVDYGIGIAEKDQSKIFDRFYQVAEIKEKTSPGLGMGLYISSEIIKRHGGEMVVQSMEGKGSTFSFTLPLIKRIKDTRGP